jgi:8-oxo-dGTP diphosphatase
MKILSEVAGVIFFNKKKELLLYLRDDKISIPYPNTWSILGGHLEKDESPIQALRREIKEEIDYNIENPIYLDYFINKEQLERVYVYKSGIDKEINELILMEGQRLEYLKLEYLVNLEMPGKLKQFILENKEKILD